MSDAISVKCPACKATLKLKSRGAVGKRVPCPKCKKPFVVQAPAADEDDMAFLDDLVPAEEEEVQEEAAPPPSPMPRKSGRKSKKPQGRSVNWLKPVLIGAAVLLFLGLLGGGGYLVATLVLFGGENKIDMTYLAPDSDMIIHVRADDVLGSPLGKSVLAIPAAKQFLDGVAAEYQMTPADIKSVTVGVSGAGDQIASTPAFPGMGGAGFGMARGRMAPPGGANARRTIVVRMSKSLSADFASKLPGYTKTEHQGKTYYRAPSKPGSPGPSIYVPAENVLIVADQSEVQRIIEKGPRQTRRADFDFVDTTPQIVVAMIQKAPAANAQAAPTSPGATGPGGMGPGGMGRGGMPIGMQGGGFGGMGGSTELKSLTGGKLKSWYLGLSFTQDLEIKVGLNCPESSALARGEVGSSIAQTRTNFQQQKGVLSMFGLGDIVPYIEQTLDSFAVVGDEGPIVQVTGRIPGGIKSGIEKVIPALAGLAKGAGGFGGGLGGGLPAGFGAPPEDDDAPAEGDADQAAEEQPAEQGN